MARNHRHLFDAEILFPFGFCLRASKCHPDLDDIGALRIVDLCNPADGFVFIFGLAAEHGQNLHGGAKRLGRGTGGRWNFELGDDFGRKFGGRQ